MLLKIKKRFERDRSSQILIDNVSWGVLSDRTLLPLYPLPFEGEIATDAFNELCALLEKQSREQLLKYLADSEHSSSQCRDYLKRKQVHPSIISRIVSDYLERKYIDDARFVRILITSLIERGKSRNHIIHKLRELSLPAELWEDVLSELYNPESSLETLKELVLKLRLQHRELPVAKQKEKVFASLFRKGFDLDLIHSAWQATKE
jgi:SOS response regulatory protein OraA/RecX